MAFGCSKRRPTRDHIHPKSRSGVLTIICCQHCNEEKGSLNLEEWVSVLQEANDPRYDRVSQAADQYREDILERLAGNGLIKFDPHRTVKKPWACEFCGRRFKSELGALSHAEAKNHLGVERTLLRQYMPGSSLAFGP
jgi:hypothetical protein